MSRQGEGRRGVARDRIGKERRGEPESVRGCPVIWEKEWFKYWRLSPPFSLFIWIFLFFFHCIPAFSLPLLFYISLFPLCSLSLPFPLFSLPLSLPISLSLCGSIDGGQKHCLTFVEINDWNINTASLRERDGASERGLICERKRQNEKQWAWMRNRIKEWLWDDEKQ